MSAPRIEKSPHFFDREPDGSVRLRLRFQEDVATLIEEAAGKTPLIQWIHETLASQAEADAAKAREDRPRVRPE